MMKKRTLISKCIHFFFEPVDSIRVDTFRIALGISLFCYLSFRATHAKEWLTYHGFHLSAEHLPYHPVYVPPLPEAWLFIFGIILFGSVISLIIGWNLKWSVWILLICLIYVTLVDQLSSFSVNKMLIVTLFILALSDHGPHWSIDHHPQHHCAWSLRVLQLLLITHLFMAGWSKAVYGEWLSNPYVLYTQVSGTYRTDFAAWMIRTLPLKGWMLLQLSALSFELFSPILLIYKKFRPIGFVWGIGMLSMIALTMHHLIYFVLVVCCFFILFVDETILHRIHNIFIKRLKAILC